MTNSSFWFSNKTEPLPPGPYQIGNSLRFNGVNEYLDRTPSQSGDVNVWTWSCWVKKAVWGTAQPIFAANSVSDADQITSWTPVIDSFGYVWRDTIQGTVQVQGHQRDPSAWNHLVYRWDYNQPEATRMRIYINGVLQTLAVNNTPASEFTMNSTESHAIGANRGGTVSPTQFFQGYMSAMYMIDGQSLDPTAFGEFNQEGVWIPIEYEGVYGATGFFLNFTPNSITKNSDGTISVADQSGLGNNWTGYNFNVETGTTNYAAYGSPTNVAAGSWFAVFDGDFVNTNVSSTGANAPLTWSPSPGLTGTTLEIYTSGNDTFASVNGGANGNLTKDGWTSFDISDDVLTSVVVDSTSQNSAINGFKLDGVLLTQATYKTDLMVDSPTSNYAILNPTLPTGGSTSDGNLQRAGATDGSGIKVSSIPLSIYKSSYFEYVASANDITQIGITDATQDFNESTQVGGAGASLANSTSNSSSIIYDGAAVQTDLPEFVVGDVIGCQLEGTTVRFFINGTQVGTDITVSDRTYVAAVSDNAQATSSDGTINFGQQPLFYLPAAANGIFSKVQPNVSVTSGYDAFRAVETSIGAAILPIAQGKSNGENNATGFPTGLWWIKKSDGNNTHQLSSSVMPNNTWGEFPGVFAPWSDFTYFDGDGVGWCWEGTAVTGDDLTAVNANGDLPLTALLRNTTAGFSTGYYNGSSTGSNESPGTELSFPHGLSQAPELVVVSLFGSGGSTQATNCWVTYTSAPSTRAQRSLVLSTNNAGTSPDTFWTDDQEATTDTLVKVRVAPSNLISNDLNRRRTCGYDADYFYMAFHSVPGYSSIGSYNGNGNDEGPFIYTGFTPAFLMVKNVSTGGSGYDWFIFDSTRTTYNIQGYSLSSDLNNAQSFQDNFDFLSNGFKVRSNAGAVNQSGNTIVYMAFASNPFVGSNVAPGTAALVEPQIPGIVDDGIDNSLRFRGSQYLLGNFSASTYTWSYWVKRGKVGGSIEYMASSGGNSGTGISFYDSTDQIQWYVSSSQANLSDSIFADPSAWYHFVVKQTAEGADGVEIYVNNQLVQKDIGVAINSTSNNFALGRYYGPPPYDTSVIYQLNGYMAEWYGIDGQALDPTDFGKYNDDGVWVPLTTEESFDNIGGTAGFGTSGFYLNMSPATVENGDTTILKDLSGNGNDFTMNGFNTYDPTQSSYDLMIDSPSRNFATLNPNFQNGSGAPGVLSAGNLGMTGDADYATAPGTITVRNGKYYWEGTVVQDNNSSSIGIIRGTNPAGNTYIGYDPNNNVYGFGYFDGGDIMGAAGTGSTTGAFIATGMTSYTTGDVIGVAVDIPSGTLEWFKNGTSVYEVTGIDDFEWMPAVSANGTSEEWAVNFGQQPFRYTPPAGYTTLEVDNLPAATVADGSDGCRALETIGAAILPAAQGELNAFHDQTGFQYGLWWTKDINGTGNHQLVDSVRGGDLVLNSDNNTPETDYSQRDGECIAWCWNVDGTAAANNDGSIQSQVAASTATGFSIVSWDGNGTAGATVGHGLDKAPEIVIVKNRTSTSDWVIWNETIFEDNPANVIFLNESQAMAAVGDNFNSTAPNDSVITLGTNTATNQTGGAELVAYCWHSVPGYSSIGSYTGNLEDKGPFIYTGFKPSFVLIKNVSDDNTNWQIHDSTRSPNNTTQLVLNPNTTGAQTNLDKLNFYSNGFQPLSPRGDENASGSTMIYMAFASNPFGGSNVSPATAALQRPQIPGLPPAPLTTVGNSIRFTGSESLSRTVPANGDRGNWTISAWVKHITDQPIYIQQQTITTGYAATLGIRNTNIAKGGNISNFNGPEPTSTAVFSDSGAWYHMVGNYGPDGYTIFMNGVEVANSSKTNGAVVNASGTFIIGGSSSQGYISEYYFIDGQTLAPETFGGYDENGNWVPREYKGVYGTNGFHLPLTSASIQGDTALDTSGNGNDFTLNGFQTTTPTDTDYSLMTDGPSQNFATLNPLNYQLGTYLNANLTWKTSNKYSGSLGDISIPTSGKWYWESNVDASPNAANNYTSYGMCTSDVNLQTFAGVEGAIYYGDRNDALSAIRNDGVVVFEGAALNVIVTGAVIQCAYDADSGKFWFGVNNEWWDASGTKTGDPATGANQTLTAVSREYFPMVQGNVQNTQFSSNFGQRAFSYTPPAGFNALQTQNLPAASITNGTDDFRAIIAPGNDILSVAQGDRVNPDGITGFKDGLWLIKQINSTDNYQMVDSVNGTGSCYQFASAQGRYPYSVPTGDSIAWCWRTPSNGINTDAGFSITTGTHGLGAVPDLVINSAGYIWSSEAFPPTTTDSYFLPDIAAPDVYPNNWVVTDTTVSSDQAGTYYCWKAIPGYSAVGKYVGNGQTPGPYQYTGFKPAMIWIIPSNPFREYIRIFDSTTNQYNPADQVYDWGNQINFSLQTETGSCRFFANGFSMNSTASANVNSFTYTWIAFAANPFGGSNVNPTDAALTPVPVVQYDEGNYSVGGSALTVGTAFTHNGIQYPANWKDILSHDYLTSIGATWIVS